MHPTMYPTAATSPGSGDLTEHFGMGTRFTGVPTNSFTPHCQIVKWSMLAQAMGPSGPYSALLWTPREGHGGGEYAMFFQLWAHHGLTTGSPQCSAASADHGPEPVSQDLHSQRVSPTSCSLWVSRLCRAHCFPTGNPSPALGSH